MFDVTPYAHAITEHFLYHEHNRRLPRKFKIGFSGSAPRSTRRSMINDVGLFAKVQPTRAGASASTWRAGSARRRRSRTSGASSCPSADLLAACEAVVQRVLPRRRAKEPEEGAPQVPAPQARRGRVPARASTRSSIASRPSAAPRSRPSSTRSIQAYKETDAAAAEPGGAALGDAAFARWQRTNAIPQKQPGYRVATVKLPLGDVTSRAAARASATSPGASATARCAPPTRRTSCCAGSRRAGSSRLHRALGAIGLAEADAGHITDVVACPGARLLLAGITKSMGVAARIREHLAPHGARSEADDIDPRGRPLRDQDLRGAPTRAASTTSPTSG